MMTFDEGRARAIAANAKPLGEILGAAPEPGVLSGALGEIPRGVGRGLAETQGLLAGAAAQATQPLYDALGEATGTEPVNPFSYLRDSADVAARRMTPDPLTVGAAGQVINGIGSIMTEVAGGALVTAATGGAAAPALMAGGAAAAGAATGRSTYRELLDKGVDPSTAANVAFETALFTGGGVLLPATMGYNAMAGTLSRAGLLTSSLSRSGFIGANAALGAAGNVSLGVAQRGMTAEILQAGGYDAMARQYAPLDTAAITADGLLGGIFSAGGAAAGLPWRAQPSTDAALAARDARDAAITRAPGAATDPDSASAHGRALDKALRDVWDGNRTDVSQTGVVNAAFVAVPRDTTVAAEALAQYGAPATPPVFPTTRLSAIPAAERAALRFDAPELNEYAAHVEQQQGLPAGLINAIKNAGERSNSGQVSPAGARGVMQFMPENLRRYGVTDPTDPVQMIDAAGRYLADTMRQYGGNVEAVIADYNGGPRQAREVLAGREPRAKETREYLARVREAMGRGQRYADTAPDMQGTVLAFPEERAREAAGIEREIAAAEAAHAELSARAAGIADLGQVSSMRSELLALEARRAELDGDGALRDATKQIQTSGPNISYKQALAEAKRQMTQTAADLDRQISRLQASVSQNADAAKALQDLAVLEQRIADLRENRQAIDVPASPPTAVAQALREMRVTPSPAGRDAPAAAADNRLAAAAQQPDVQPAQLPGEGDPSPQAAMGSVRPVGAAPASVATRAARPSPDQHSAAASEPPRGGEAGGPRREVAVADDIETQAGLALLDERGDITVPAIDANGNEVQVSLRQALAEANAELDYARPEAFQAAVLCQLRGGA